MLVQRDVDDDHNTASAQGVVIGVICAAVLLVVGALLAGYAQRRRYQAIRDIPTRRDSFPPTDSAVPWLSFSSRPTYAPPGEGYPPPSSSSFAYYPGHSSMASAGDAAQLIPPHSPCLPPEPASPSYSPLVPQGHTTEAPASAAAGEEGEGQGTSAGRRDHGLTLKPQSLQAADGELETPPSLAAPPPYSPKIVGVGSDLRRGG